MELAAAGDDAQPLAVANYGALPTDVLHDILLRLPADEVCRLRLVCHSWRSLTSDPLFAAEHASRHQHVVVVSHYESSPDEAEARAVDLHGDVIKRRRIRRLDGALGPLSVHADLLCVSHGWGLAYVVDMVTGAVVADMTAEHPRRVNAMRPECVLGHVPSTGEYKVLRVQVEYSTSQRQTFEVVTLGGGARRWRRLPRPPFRLSTKLMSGSGNVAVVAGLAYFLVRSAWEDQPSIKADSIAVFDLTTEEWKPATLQGPLRAEEEARTRRRKATGPQCLKHVRNPNRRPMLVIRSCGCIGVAPGSWQKHGVPTKRLIAGQPQHEVRLVFIGERGHSLSVSACKKMQCSYELGQHNGPPKQTIFFV